MPIMRLVLLFLGVHTSVTDNFLLFVYSGKTYRFAISYEQFAFSFFMLISLTLFFYHIIKSKRIKIFTTQLLITIFYFICRYIVLIFIFIYVNDIGIFYEPFYLIVSILPLCLILSVHNRKKSTNYKNISIFANFKLNLLTAFLFSLTVSVFVYAVFLFDGADAEKTGQIYIDEYHSDGWEAIFEPLNTENFGGQKSTYTYFSFVRILEKIKPVHVITKSDDYENITAEDILIIKTPTVDFTEEEMKKIDSILKKGAGVWIIGDHTNLLDMSSRLNKIIEPYGARFNYDAVYDLATSNLTYFDNTLLPLFKHRINSVLSGYKFATSCSIKTSPLYHKIMIANNACSEYLDLSHQNYFGDLSFSEEEYFGLFCQCAAKKVGKGRLLIYSDSTTLSSFSIFMHTNPEFVFSSISYLNKKNSFNYPALLSCIFLLLSVFLLLYTCKTRAWQNMKNVVIMFVIFLSPLLIIMSNINDIDNAKFKTKIEDKINLIPTICFLQNKEDYDDTLIVRWWSSGIDEYTSLFLAFQRLGFQLRDVKKLTNFDPKTNLMTVITKPLSSRENIRNTITYCKAGGRILLFLSDRNLNDSLSFLNKFGINYTVTQNTYSTSVMKNEQPDKPSLIMLTNVFPNSYSYVKSYFSENYLNIRLDEFSFGSTGKIYVLINAQFFDNIGLGEAATIPTNRQIMLHKEFFDLINQLGIK